MRSVPGLAVADLHKPMRPRIMGLMIPTMTHPKPLAFLLLLLSLGDPSNACAKETSESLLKKARAVLARLEGEIHVPGLKQSVEVLRDRWGVAHIYAKNPDDLFFAQGFVAAQDRLFQMDMWRRVAVGETAAIRGP